MKSKDLFRPVVAVTPQHQDRGFISAWLEEELPHSDEDPGKRRSVETNKQSQPVSCETVHYPPHVIRMNRLQNNGIKPKIAPKPRLVLERRRVLEGCEGSSGGVESRRTSLFERLVKTAAVGRGGVSLAPHTVNRNTAFFPESESSGPAPGPCDDKNGNISHYNDQRERLKCMEMCESVLQEANQEIEEAELKIRSLNEGVGYEVDIDDNIQRLEQSHQQISEVLDTFRNIKSARTNSLNNLRRRSSLGNQEAVMKESPSDYFSDSESSTLQIKHKLSRIFGSFDKGCRREVPVSKSRSVDMMLNDESLEEDFSKCFQSTPKVSDKNQRYSSQSTENLQSSFNSFNQSEVKSESLEEEIQALQPSERKVLYIAKEIMTSEKVYVDVLKLLNIDFKNFIHDARKSSKSQIIPTEQFLKIFSNLPEMMMLNSELLRDFEERVQNWTSSRKISDIIVKKGPYLKLYTTYVKNHSSTKAHFEECCSKYPKFGKLVKEFEKFPQCRNLKLSHFFLKPIQRLPQYKLLLEDYLRHLDTNSQDYDDTATALTIVTQAAHHANETIKQTDKFQKMLSLQSRLGDHEIILPGRELVREGELEKISRKGVNTRYFVLLSDCLLYCTNTSNTLTGPSLKVSYTIPLEELIISLVPGEETEFSITSSVRSCSLRARNVHERNCWLESLNSAVEEQRSRRASFNKSGDPCVGVGVPDVDQVGDRAPVWVPDGHVTRCQQCGEVFTPLSSRRHHCRACGQVLCSACTDSKAPLRYTQFQPARVCQHCFSLLLALHGQDPDLATKFKAGTGLRTERKVSAVRPQSVISGQLSLRLNSGKWRRSWYLLTEDCLHSYAGREDTLPSTTINLLQYSSVSGKGLLTFILGSEDPDLQLHFTADTESARDAWVEAITHCLPS